MPRSKLFLLDVIVAVVVVLGLAALVLLVTLRGRATRRPLSIAQVQSSLACQMNLARLGKGLLLYANDSGDYLPPYRMRFRSGKPYAEWVPSPDACHWVAKEGDLDPLSLKQKGRNLGIAFFAGHIQPDDCYCPDQTSPQYVRSSYPEPWPSHDPWSSLIRSGYMYNPNEDPRASSPGPLGRRTSSVLGQLSTFPRDRPLAMDLAILPWAWVIHGGPGASAPPASAPAGSSPPGMPARATSSPPATLPSAMKDPSQVCFNMVFIDGRVESFANPGPTGMDLIMDWGTISKSFAPTSLGGHCWNTTLAELLASPTSQPG